MPGSILVRSASAGLRTGAALEWLAQQPRDAGLLAIGATREAAAEILREAASERGALFGWRATSLASVARQLAAADLAARGRVAAGALGAEAIAARIVHVSQGRAGSVYAAVADTPGFPRALAGSLAEVRLAGLPAASLSAVSEELAGLAEAFGDELDAQALADWAQVLTAAASSVAGGVHPFLGYPVILLDVPIRHRLEANLVRAIIAQAPASFSSLPAADTGSFRFMSETYETVRDIAPDDATSLSRVQRYLFAEHALDAEPDDSLVLLSAPGVARECVEVARGVLAAARGGTPFDRMAVLLRSPGEYQPHLEEALRRARVPVYFARGVTRPDPAGRALAALIRCRLENLSARRFAEYLSLGEVPPRNADGGPPPSSAQGDLWRAPDDEQLDSSDSRPGVDETQKDSAAASADADEHEGEPGMIAEPLTTPRRWERLLVEAAVVGGADRWQRRLAGLDHELTLDLQALDDPDDPAADRLRRERSALAELTAFALPLLDDLQRLPDEGTWAEHLAALAAVATRAVRHPDRALGILAALSPLGPVGPVSLREVARVLDRHLVALTVPAIGTRYGRLFVAPIEAALGMSFDVVFVPGLAEKLMPHKVTEEPVLLDEDRQALSADLATNADRAAQERLRLAAAAGAASRRLVLSYPRLDAEIARPRVPSFYTLEVVRAAQGRLPSLATMSREADQVAPARLGWPAPARPEDAIDEAEYDLAVLDRLKGMDEAVLKGQARYLMDVNPHLARSLRARARRWLPGWTPADGLVAPSEAALDALQNHRLAARSYSPTALQNYATCPYKFYLYAVHRLSKRELPAPIDALDPLQRGSLFHEAQFELLTELRDAGLLPIRAANLADAGARLDSVLDRVADDYREKLAPAIDRVWRDGVGAVRADLAEWLRRSGFDDSGFVPWRFELSFGLPERRRTSDAHSADEPVSIEAGLILRGSIDLVERAADGTLRVTDHKTGKVRMEPGGIIEGGRSLQPVLYALAAETLFDVPVMEGRLYYCTLAAGYAERTVKLNDAARAAAALLAAAVDGALAEGRLPAYPEPGACRWCDYRVVCGPNEEARTIRKTTAGLAPLLRLRSQP